MGMLSLCAGPAFAQAPASTRADLQRAVTAAETATVVTTDGRRLTGALEKLTDTTLTLRARGQSEAVPFDRISEVKVRRSDPLWNGVLIGAGIGAVAGLIPDYYDDCEECHDALYGSIAVGAGVGLIVDALVRSARPVYRMPSTQPALSFGVHVTRQRAAVAARFSF